MAKSEITEAEVPQSSRYVVCDEHTLGFKHTNNCIEILRASVLRGAVFELYPAPKLAIMFNTLRQATLQDFKVYRVVPPPGFAGPEGG